MIMRDITYLKEYYNGLGRIQRLFFPWELGNALNRDDVAPIDIFKLANTVTLRVFALTDNNFDFFNRPRVILWCLFQKRGLLESRNTLTNFNKIAQMTNIQLDFLIATTNTLKFIHLLSNFALTRLIRLPNQQIVFKVITAMHHAGLLTGEMRHRNFNSLIINALYLMHQNMGTVWQNIPPNSLLNTLSQRRWDNLITICEQNHAHTIQHMQQIALAINPFFTNWSALLDNLEANNTLPLTLDDEIELDQPAPIVLNTRPAEHYRIRFFRDRRIGVVEIPANVNVQPLNLAI